jgi:putative DNA primase/helicase
VLWERPLLDVINVQNGLLNVETGELSPHSPDHLSSVQLPIKYDPAAKCPAIEEFVRQVFPADAFNLAWEMPAWLMLPDTSIQKSMLLLGAGGNGKSTWLALILAFLGSANTSSVSLHRLEADRFAVSRLYGKLANICPDLPSEHLAGTSVFKAITGGDPLTGEYKFKDSFDFVAFSRLVFSANTLPQSKDSSQGFFDRWLVIPFERSFRGTSAEIPRKVLDARLSAPAELSGLLNKALDALARMTRQNGLSQPASVRKASLDFQATTDPLPVWLDLHTVETPNALVVKKDLRFAFNEHLRGQALSPMTETGFAIAFARHRPHIRSKQRKVNGKVQRCYIGIGFRSQLPANSQGSQGSQGYPSINQSRGRGAKSRTEGRKEWRAEQDRANPVNPVKPVKDAVASESPPEACGHLHMTPDRWVHRDGSAYCPQCDRFMGRVGGGE